MADSYSATQKLAELERELRYRWRVYPRLVAHGKMLQGAMDRQIAIMSAITEDYRALAEKERLL